MPAAGDVPVRALRWNGNGRVPHHVTKQNKASEHLCELIYDKTPPHRQM